ncbi:MAG TPA: hypothetical protein VFP73_13490 [Terrabacter sp.]|nr:hypothetical protein [Terrabacter sp.]
MNVTDLRDELTTHADDLGAAPDFRAGIAARVRRTKRRRATAAGAATLAVAALAVGLVGATGRQAPAVPAGRASGTATSTAPMIGSDGMPYRTVPDAPGDVVKDGLRYRAKVADDTLAAGFIGDPGQAQFSLAWEPTTVHVSVGAECYLPDLTQDEASAYLVTLGLEGRAGFFGSQCKGGRPTERDLPAGGAVPGEPGQGWTELTVGRSARLRVQLVDAKTSKPASVEGAQLTGAVYEQGRQQPVVDSTGRTVASLPDVVEHQGYRYELIGIEAAPLASWHDLTTGVPAGMALVTWGSAGDNLTGSSATADSGTRLTGLPSGTEGHGYGSWGTSPVPDGSDHTVTVTTVGPRPDHGTGFLALYTLEH